MSEVKTVRVYPYRTGYVDGQPSASWENAENAMQPGGGVSTRVIAAGAQTAPQQHWTFRAPIPTFAKIVGARWITRASVSGAPSVRLRRYTFLWIYPDGTRSSGWTNVNPSNTHGPVMEEVSGTFTQQALDMFNGLPNSRPTPYIGMRHNFSASCSLQLPAPAENDVLVSVDYVAFEFDYITPPMPWKGSVHIQGDPMTTQKIKQGSNAPNISVSVIDATGAPLDLRGCKLSLVARSSSNEFGGEVTITDAEQGKGFYAWQENDTSVPGLYRVELVTEWLDGSRVIIPFDRYGLIEVVPSL